MAAITMLRVALGLALSLMAAAPGLAQTPAEGSPGAAWPYPPPDPRAWWEAERPAPRDAADPMARRRLPRSGPAPVTTPIEPTLYRLWGLPPLQTQVVYGGEAILEVWRRPSNSVEQMVIRLTARRDGKAFVQVRAGRACCEPDIARRVGFDAELPAGYRSRILELVEAQAWNSPRDAVAQEGSASVGSICLDGVSYDLVRLTERAGGALRRDCDPAEVGEVADLLETAIGAAMGHEPRIDVLLPRGADFSRERAAYEALIAGGGRIKPADRPPAS
ncbi:MAG: hypothetical protein Q7S93_07715 [Phenylobacterium sp.]|uniref:hypothetical protein n=1 Tax=Phenylobacterium sp. TaxID=1871053 RepID=UPI0027198BB5|nr:hypothetical protein [Phenylobacterium sp.]MDO8409931.1 hypothetical protein [Phenylobacterium sp.]